MIEVLAESTKGREDAAQAAVTTAAKSVRHVRSINIDNLQATGDDQGRINNYRINARIAFELK